jgi:DNA-directed RNA polymerase specialized sigma24 family protein
MADLDLHLRAIVAGDADAFGRWIVGAEPLLRSSLRPFAARVDGEAILQESLLRIWQVAGRVVPDGRPNSLLRFGLRVTQNLARTEARRLRPELLDDPTLPDVEVIDAPEPDPALRQRLATCFAKLPGKPLAALRARLDRPADPDGMLAAALRMRLNTFLQNLTRARRLLETCLDRAGIRLSEVLR